MKSLPESARKSFTLLAFLALTAISIVVFMGKSYENSLQALDSTTHAMLAMEVTSKGASPVLPMPNFVTNLRSAETFNDHPFTVFYLSGQVMRFFGADAWSARLLPGLFSVGCVVLLAILGAMMYSPAVGLVAGLILAFTRDFIIVGSRFHLDTAMVFFILLSFIAFWKRRWVCMGIAAGLGLWMKTPVAFLVFPSALLALWMSGELNRKLFLRLVLSGLIAVAVGSMVWIYTGMNGGWHLVADYWTRQVYGTAVQGRGAPEDHEKLMGIHMLYHTYHPWLILLVGSLISVVIRKRWKAPEVALCLAAVLIIQVVVSAVRFKFFWYYLPMFPFLALLCLEGIHQWLHHRSVQVMSAIMGLGIFLPTLLVATPIELGPENFPAFRRFEPIIQQYGTCSDRVLFIEGGQPFGGPLDNIYELSFYTGRKILQADCKTAFDVVKAHAPEWITMTDETRVNCLTESLLKPYKTQYRFGRQWLVSKIIPKESELDLTAFARELKPVQPGCVVVPYSNNPYFPKR